MSNAQAAWEIWHYLQDLPAGAIDSVDKVDVVTREEFKFATTRWDHDLDGPQVIRSGEATAEIALQRGRRIVQIYHLTKMR